MSVFLDLKMCFVPFKILKYVLGLDYISILFSILWSIHKRKEKTKLLWKNKFSLWQLGSYG